ncbi:MAG: hypothetical protein HYY04_06050 [Chloroflexi bacterium]|nr:hypothetical protein [Chloroflexota bacterium]
MSRRVESEAVTAPRAPATSGREGETSPELSLHPSPRWERIEPLTSVQQLYLRRLRRLVALVRICERNLDPSEPEVRLTRWAIYSTYCDCRALCLESGARQILSRPGDSTRT